jgi:hypothetical protein
LTPGSYEAYCLDEAAWYLGTFLEGELQKAGRQKKQKGEAQAEAARKRVLAKYLDSGKKSSQYMDPALLFAKD